MKNCCDCAGERWAECIFCKRRFLEMNLEFDLCCDCLDALRFNPDGYNHVKITQMLKYVDFQDRELAEVVRMIWGELTR
jgi:hypothetical protein